MLSQIKRFLENSLQADTQEATPADREHRLALAATALMLQIATIDQDEDEREIATILDAAGTLTSFTAAERQQLLALARERADDATSLYEFTGIINELCAHEERLDIVEQLWRVALADQNVDRYEEHLIRRIAELFHLAPSEFVQCRHRAQGSR